MTDTNKTSGAEVLHAIDQADIVFSLAGLRQDDIFRIELRQARAAVAELIERDALAAEVKALREDGNEWQASETTLLKVMIIEGDEPFVFAVRGRMTARDIAHIEAQLKTDPPSDIEGKGDGDYTFVAKYEPGQYGEYGQCEFPPGWGLDLIAFEPLDAARASAATGGGNG